MKTLTKEERKARTTAYRGALYLCKRSPAWREFVNERSLDIGSGMDCVLGQVYGDYEDGMAVLWLSHGQAVRYGFIGNDPASVSAAMLTDAWREVLKRF